PWLERHDAEISFPVARPKPDRICPHSSVTRALWPTLRSPDHLRLEPGRLRLRLQILRQRTGRLDAQSRCRRGRATAHRDKKNFVAKKSITSFSWAWANRWLT